jgi:hypothetical protein
MYDKEQILIEAIEAIRANELTTIPEVESYLPCDESTLYSNEEWKLEVLEPIKKELSLMKINLKAKMKKSWRKEGSNPVLQIAAFKLMATEDELTTLSTSRVQNELTGKDGQAIQTENKLTVEIVKTTDYQTK